MFGTRAFASLSALRKHAHVHCPFTCALGNESGTPFTHLQEARTSTLQPAKATAGTGETSQRDEWR